MTADSRISDEHAQALSDREWWREAGETIGLELNGWTYRDVAQFSDRETGRTIYLPGTVAARLRERRAQAVTVTNDMVERAYNAWVNHHGNSADTRPHPAMRAALEAVFAAPPPAQAAGVTETFDRAWNRAREMHPSTRIANREALRMVIEAALSAQDKGNMK